MNRMMNGSHMLGDYHGGIYWIFRLLRGISVFILPVILLYLIYYFIKTRNKKNFKKYESPLDRLKIRLAKGEITKEEYEELKKIVEEE